MYIDFAKPFDVISHVKLLYKLKLLNVHVSVINIIKNFLSNRCQRVKIDNVLSEPVCMGIGVPQGSVIGPFLFLIYVNDLSDCLPSSTNTKIFADDAKLFTEVKSDTDIESFPEAIDSLTD